MIDPTRASQPSTRTTLVLPRMLASEVEDSPLRQRLPTLLRLAEQGSVSRLAALPDAETPEVMLLGMDPTLGQMRQGPLTVSALGADPPERSTHFHLSLMSLHEGIAARVGVRIPADEQAKILELGKRLNTPLLTSVAGDQTDHGLVWEAFGDLETTPASEIEGQDPQTHFPAGDGDRLLRRFIDDSVNLLSEQEFNVRRAEAGLPTLNLLWPWGHGVRLPMPNLALRRGEPAMVLSGGLRLAGLARLVGYRNGDRSLLGNGLNAKWEVILDRVRQWNGPTLVVVDAFEGLSDAGKTEEMHWLLREIDKRFLEPLMDASLLNPTRLTILATGKAGGLALRWDSTLPKNGVDPFDERAFEESRLPEYQLWEAAAMGFS